jgi:leucyl aminopeptidase
MQFSTKTIAPEKLKKASILLPIYRNDRLGVAAATFDKLTGNLIAKTLARGDLAAKVGSTLLVHGFSSPKQAVTFDRLVLVRMEGEQAISKKQFTEATRAGLRHMIGTAAIDTISYLHEAEVSSRDLSWKIRCQVMVTNELTYRADQWKGNREVDTCKIKSVQFAVDKENGALASKGLKEGIAISDGVQTAKDLGNAPGNVCTPVYLGECAKQIGKANRIKVQVLNEKQIKALGMGSFLAVAQGSDQPPRLIVMEYNGGPSKQAPVALVGKGITFDTGGISLKPGPEMDEMKFDMCGAASVLGTMQAVAELKLPINVVGVVVAAENMPSGKAIKPGDVVKSMSGQTIEILNTDAEGRLILCDALTYVARFKPSTVIDIATLTGACVIALGGHHSGLFTADEKLSNALRSAGESTGDTCWPMPLDEEYHEGLKSNFADMANIGGRPGGAIVAACFLAKFAKGYDWAHLDIAGTAWKSGAAKGGTGRPVPLLTQYLIDRSAK